MKKVQLKKKEIKYKKKNFFFKKETDKKIHSFKFKLIKFALSLNF